MPAKAAPPPDPDIARLIGSRREYESEGRKLMQVPEVVGKRLNGEARLRNLGRRVESDEIRCPTLQFGRVDLVPNTDFEMRHLAVVRKVSLPIPEEAKEQAANCDWNELTHLRLTTSLSHSRRAAKLRRSQGARNPPKPSKTEGAAAVGCRERVRASHVSTTVNKALRPCLPKTPASPTDNVWPDAPALT